MNRLLPPLCLLLALAMLVVGFGLLAVEPPEASVELHHARVTGDEQYQEVLEAQLRRRQRIRTALLVCLFGGSALFAVLGFVTMRPTGSTGKQG